MSERDAAGSDLARAAARRKGIALRAIDSRPARAVARAIRSALVRRARARPRPKDDSDPPRVTILTVSGWGRGGTTRAILNLAGYLKDRREVEIVGLWRQVDEPFFEHPDGVEVHALEDLRPGHAPRGVAALMARLPSVLVHPDEIWATSFSLLSDIRLVRKLRRRTGILISTGCLPCMYPARFSMARVVPPLPQPLTVRMVSFGGSL